MRRTVAALMALMSATAVAAPAQQQIQLTGQILPAGCAVEVEGSAALDFGSYGYHDLQEGAVTQLGNPRRVVLAINCERSMGVGFEVQDHNAHASQPDNTRMNLAVGEDQVLAWYTLSGVPTWDAGRPGSLVRDEAGDGQWKRGSGVGTGWLHSVGRNGANEPTEFQNAKVGLNVRAYAAPREQFDPSQPLDMAGSLTFSLKYL